MRKIAIVLATLLSLSLLSVASAEDTVTVKIDPLNNSGISGTATLTAMGNQTQVDVALDGEPAGDSEPAHLHVGQCGPTLGAVKYPLKNIEGGKSTTLVNATLQSLENGQFALNVHKSAADIKTYVACGNVPAMATTTTASPTSLPKTGGAPAALIVALGGALLGAGYVLRRRSA